VKKALFSTYCTTCRARIAVLRTEAIGQILDCPKCGSMVQIVPPEGWAPPEADPALAGAFLPDVQTGPPPLNKVRETYLALDAGEQTAATGLVQRLLTLLKAKMVWICGVAGVGLMFFAIWAVWTSVTNQDAALPASDKISVDPNQSKQPGAVAVAPDASRAKEKTLSEIQDERLPAIPLQAKSQEEGEQTTVKDAPPVKGPKQDLPQHPAEAEKPKPTPSADKPAEKQPDKANHNAPPARATATQPVKPALPLPETSAVRLVKMVAPESLDLDQRLGMVLPELELTDMPLARALALIAAMGNVPLTIDPDALRLAGASPRDRVSIHLRGASLEQLFEAVAEKRGLGLDAGESQVGIALPLEDREKLRLVRYKVSDLCPDQKSLEGLAAQIRRVVSPATWKDSGGEGTMQTENDTLLVTQCGAEHREILVFCEKLRLARGLPLRSKYPPSRFLLPTRSAQAGPVLRRAVSANFHEPAPLVQVLGELASQAGADVLIDRRALAAEEMTDAMEVAYTVAGKSLGAALAEILPPLKLDFRPVDATTVQITTPRALRACREIEFYPIPGRDVSKLIERIKTTVAPDSWQAAGKTAAIEYDPPSQTLIVLQSPPVQAALEKFLSRKP
jgi:hypothetical protein